MNTILEIFLIVDALIIGIVATLALQHGLAHFKPDKHDAEKLRPKPETGRLPAEMKQQMQEKARANFEATIDKYTTQLQKDLRASEDNLSARLEKLSVDIIKKESGRYEQELANLHQEVEAADKTTVSELKQQQAEMKAKLEQDIAEQKKQRLETFDAKMADAVTSFLLSTLGRDVDLGAQEKYLLKQLDTHKAEIIKGISDET